MNVHRHPVGQVAGVPEHVLVVAHPVRVADARRDGRVLLGGALDDHRRRPVVHQVDDVAGAAYRVDDGRVAGGVAHLTAVIVVAAAAAVVIVDGVQVDDLVLVDDVVPVRRRRHDDGGRRVVVAGRRRPADVVLHVAAERGCGWNRRRRA